MNRQPQTASIRMAKILTGRERENFRIGSSLKNRARKAANSGNYKKDRRRGQAAIGRSGFGCGGCTSRSRFDTNSFCAPMIEPRTPPQKKLPPTGGTWKWEIRPSSDIALAVIVLLSLCFVLSWPTEAASRPEGACTAFVMRGGGALFLAKTLDWPVGEGR